MGNSVDRSGKLYAPTPPFGNPPPCLFVVKALLYIKIYFRAAHENGTLTLWVRVAGRKKTPEGVRGAVGEKKRLQELVADERREDLVLISCDRSPELHLKLRAERKGENLIDDDARVYAWK